MSARELVVTVLLVPLMAAMLFDTHGKAGFDNGLSQLAGMVGLAALMAGFPLSCAKWLLEDIGVDLDLE